MSAISSSIGIEIPTLLGRSDAQLVGKQIRLMLSSSGPNCSERRRDQRFAFPQLLELTPVDYQTLSPQGETIVVVGKHVSENGLGFYHQEPLVDRCVLATVERSGGARLQFLLDLSWCRFKRQGWYESGGRFLPAANSPEHSAAG